MLAVMSVWDVFDGWSGTERELRARVKDQRDWVRNNQATQEHGGRYYLVQEVDSEWTKKSLRNEGRTRSQPGQWESM